MLHHERWLSYMILILVTEGTLGLKITVNRNPRSLVFPPGLGNKIQVICGLGIPVDLDRTSLTYGYIIKSNYALPENATQFTQPDIAFEPARSQARWSLYSALAAAFRSIGGQDCILKAICQSAFAPIDHDGLLGELLHIIFTPSTTWDDGTYGHYNQAEKRGRQADDKSDCDRAYPKCASEILDLVSTLQHSFFSG